ncbi:MAG: hypothetical protein OEX12_02985 [Gammaproteobacteria bacterium]|nr:hypothetical protein [Gammaproteobacteria bacterium]
MTIKLTQKSFLKGSREFEIVDDSIYVRIKSLLKEEKLTIGLSILSPEPVVNMPYLHFHSRFKSEPLLSLLFNKPNENEFNAFVDTLSRRALEESAGFSGIKAFSPPAGIAANVHEEPPEFEDLEQSRLRFKEITVDPAEVDNMIQMLEKYVDAEDIKPLLSTMQALKAEPQNETTMQQVVDAFNDLGISQGAVLTYAPYISVLLSDDPFANH